MKLLALALLLVVGCAHPKYRPCELLDARRECWVDPCICYFPWNPEFDHCCLANAVKCNDELP